MGAAARNAKGWRSIPLPILGVVFAVLLPLLVTVMLGSAVFSLELLGTMLGF